MCYAADALQDVIDVDACRSNPFTSSRSFPGGLAGMTVNQGKGQYSSLKNICVVFCSRAQPLLEVTHEHPLGGIGHIGSSSCAKAWSVPAGESVLGRIDQIPDLLQGFGIFHAGNI